MRLSKCSLDSQLPWHIFNYIQIFNFIYICTVKHLNTRELFSSCFVKSYFSCCLERNNITSEIQQAELVIPVFLSLLIIVHKSMNGFSFHFTIFISHMNLNDSTQAKSLDSPTHTHTLGDTFYLFEYSDKINHM